MMICGLGETKNDIRAGLICPLDVLPYAEPQDFHRWLIAAALAAAFLTILAITPTATLTWVEMYALQMRSCIIICEIPLTVSAGFAVSEELLVERDIHADPDFAHPRVHLVDVSTQLVVAKEALWLVVAQGTVPL